jgi:hypothetical protein
VNRADPIRVIEIGHLCELEIDTRGTDENTETADVRGGRAGHAKSLKPSSRSAFDRMGSSRALVTESPLANMSQIKEFRGQPRNDSLCAAAEFWRGSLSQGRKLSCAQTFGLRRMANGLH